MAISAPDQEDLAVLVIDDEPRLAESLGAGLAAVRHQALIATSGEAALRHLAERRDIAVVVTDVRMPDCDGLDLAQRILAERDEVDAVEVVVISGHATMETAATAVSTRVSALLYKPFRLSAVLKAVEVAMAQARKRRAAARAAAAASARLAAFETERGQLLEWLGQARERLASLPDDTSIAHAVHGEVSAIATTLLQAPQGARPAEALPAEAEALRQLRENVERSVGTLGLLEELYALPEDAGREAGPAEPVAWPELVARVLRFRAPDLADHGLQASPGAIAAPPTVATPRGLERTLDRAVLAAISCGRAGDTLHIAGHRMAMQGRPWSVIDLHLGKPGPGVPDDAPSHPAFEDETLGEGSPHGLLAFQIARRRARALGGEFSAHGDQRDQLTFRLAIPAAPAQ